MKLVKDGNVVELMNENVIAGYMTSGYVPFVEEPQKTEKKKTVKKTVKE